MPFFFYNCSYTKHTHRCSKHQNSPPPNTHTHTDILSSTVPLIVVLFSERLKRRTSTAIHSDGIPAFWILLTHTHTHSGKDYKIFWRGWLLFSYMGVFMVVGTKMQLCLDSNCLSVLCLKTGSSFGCSCWSGHTDTQTYTDQGKYWQTRQEKDNDQNQRSERAILYFFPCMYISENIHFVAITSLWYTGQNSDVGRENGSFKYISSSQMADILHTDIIYVFIFSPIMLVCWTPLSVQTV